MMESLEGVIVVGQGSGTRPHRCSIPPLPDGDSRNAIPATLREMRQGALEVIIQMSELRCTVGSQGMASALNTHRDFLAMNRSSQNS